MVIIKSRSDLRAPCMGCQKREPRCHGHCEEYKTWHDSMPKFDEAKRNMNDYRADRRMKTLKALRNKGRWRHGNQ